MRKLIVNNVTLILFLSYFFGCVTITNTKKYKNAKTNSKESILISNALSYAPNSAGGVNVGISIENLSSKPYKYIYFSATPYNSVNDMVKCQIRGYSTTTLKATGPIEPQKFQWLNWENVWYNNSLDFIKLENVKIIYMDNTEEMIDKTKLSKVIITMEHPSDYH